MNDLVKLVNYHKRANKTRKFDAVLKEISKSGKTYAEWQKARYASLYDVKGHIEQYKRTAEMQKHFGYKVSYGDTFRIVGKLKGRD